MRFGTWFADTEPKWKSEIENLSERELEKNTGISKDKLIDILEYLYEEDIIR